MTGFCLYVAVRARESSLKNAAAHARKLGCSVCFSHVHQHPQEHTCVRGTVIRGGKLVKVMARRERKGRRAIDGHRIKERLSFIHSMYDQYDIEPRLRLAFVLWLHGTSAIASYSTLRHGGLLL